MDNGASSYRRFLDGDDEGLAEIVAEYKDGLILYLRTFVSDIYSAEELAEDTFFRLMVKKPRFSGKSSFKSWLYAIGRNATVDYIRHNSRISDTPVEDMAECLADESDLEKSYIREEDKLQVRRALNNLSHEYQQIIWLVFFEDLSSNEAGQIMRKSPRQIRNLLYRAKQSLRSELEKEGFIYEKL